MLKQRIVRFMVAWLFDQMNDETITMLNEEIDKELEERGFVLPPLKAKRSK